MEETHQTFIELVTEHVRSIIPSSDPDDCSAGVRAVMSDLKALLGDAEIPDKDVGKGLVYGLALLVKKAQLREYSALYDIINKHFINSALKVSILDLDEKELENKYPAISGKEFNSEYGQGVKLAYYIHDECVRHFQALNKQVEIERDYLRVPTTNIEEPQPQQEVQPTTDDLVNITIPKWVLEAVKANYSISFLNENVGKISLKIPDGTPLVDLMTIIPPAAAASVKLVCRNNEIHISI